MPKQLTLMFIQIGYQVNPEIIKNYVVWALNCATLMQALDFWSPKFPSNWTHLTKWLFSNLHYDDAIKIITHHGQNNTPEIV